MSRPRAAFLAGIGIVLLMERFDRRVRSPVDLDLEIPLLAVLNAWRPAGGRLLGRPAGTGPALPNPG